MRLLLLLSAMMTALVGAGGGARPAAAQSYATVTSRAEAVQAARAVAQSHRPASDGFASIAANVTQLQVSGARRSVPLYAERLRV